MLGTTLKRRYKIEQLLARGEQGTLFLGTDVTSGEMLAVKVFPPEVDFRNEAGLRYLRAMQRLQGLAHPNLLIPLDTGFSEGVAFQVTPYTPALSLEQALAEAPFSHAEALALLRQTAAALARLHEAGLAHLNLKPSNLLVSREEGRLEVVVADPARPLLNPGEFPYGGPAAAPYRAPEEIPLLEMPPGPAADLYALAMLGWLVLTGKAPFTGITARQIALQHLAALPPPLTLPEGEAIEGPPLEPILRRLAEKEPAARYPSAAALLAELDPGAPVPHPPALVESPAAPAAPPGSGGAVHAPPPAIPLLGRATENDALASALSRAGTGRGTLLVLAGAIGAGKAALFERLVPRVAAGEGLVLRAHLPPGPWCAPFQAPLMWLEDLARQWETLPITRRRYLAGRLGAALGPNAAILAALFPPIAELLGEPPRPPPLLPERQPYRVLHVLTETFAALAESRHPLVLWLGGTEAADEDTVAWLEALLLRLHQLPLVLVAGYAPTGPGGAGAFQHWIQEAVREPAVQWLEVPPLDTAACAGLLKNLLTGPASLPAPGAPLLEKLGAWIRERWGGNPLAHRMAVEWLQAQGLLRRERGGGAWGCDWERLAALPAPGGLEGLLAKRVESLPENEQFLLGAASVFPGAFSLEALGGLMEHLPPEVVLERVEQAVTAGWLRRTGAGLRLAHPALGAACQAALPEGRKTHFHRLLGALGEAAPGPAPLCAHHVTARHFLLGGDPTRYLRHGLAVAGEALATNAVRGAAAWWRALLPHLGNDARLPQALTALAESHLRLGDAPAALEALAQCEGLDLPDEMRGEVLRLGATAETLRGEGAAAVPLLEEALGLLGESLPSSQMGAVLARLARGARRRYVELRLAAGGPAPAELEQREEKIVALLELLALAMAGTDPERAQLADEKLVQFTAAHKPAPPTVRALLRLGEAHGNPDDPSLTEAGDLAAEGGFLHEEAERNTVVGRCRFNLFDLPGAREALFRAHEAFGRFGDPIGKGEALRWVVEVERLQGPAGTLLDRARRLARLRGMLASEADVAWGRAVQAYCEALAGKKPCGEAAQELKSLAEKAREADLHGPFAYFLFLCADLLLGSGRPGDARNCLEAFPAAGGEGQDFWGLLLDTARAESHLLHAQAVPEDGDWHTAQAEKLIRRLSAAGKPFPRLAVETARLRMMAHLHAGKADAALELAHQWEGLLDGQNARIALGRMMYRLAEGLKTLKKASWRGWGERALSLFETTGAAPFAAAAREVLEQPPAGIAAPEPGDRHPAGRGSTAPHAFPPGAPREEALLEQLERVLNGEAPDAAALHRPLLKHLAESGGADFAVLLLPDGEGRPAPVETWAAAGEVGEVNPWLLETVWTEKRPELVERFLLSPEENRARPGSGGAQTALCVPLMAGGEMRGAAYLARGEGPRPFDQADLSRAVQAAHQAALALALGEAVATGKTARREAEAEHRRWELLTEWSARSGAEESAERILFSLLREVGFPNGFTGALLYWAEPATHRLRLGPRAADPPPAAGLEAFQVLSLLGGETSAAKALEGAGAVPAVAQRADGAPTREGALLDALGAQGGLWLPLAAGERNVGAVLLYGPTLPAVPAEGWEARLAPALRLIAPALYQARRADLVAAERDALAERENQLLETTHRLQRFVPAQLRQEQPNPGPHLGAESWTPVTFGQIFETGALAGLGARETMEQLHAYYGRVNEALALHQGVLERIMGSQWVARYERGAENALWGTLTMYQMLLGYQDERAALGAPTLKTGLGVHLGQVIGGMVETEQRAEPVLLGEGLQVAARLAELCRTFRTGILVSAEAVQGLENPAPFDLRSLGFFRIAPAGRKVGVYELFSTREPEVRDSMRTRRGEWNAALRHYQLGEWKEGAEGFRAYLETLPQDRAARHFLRHCRQRASWDGGARAGEPGLA